MANEYATVAQARAYGYQSQVGDESLLTSCITRASRVFDRACGLPDGYFAETDSGTAASARKFWGNGTDFLHLDPYHIATAPTLTMPIGFTVPDYEEVNSLKSPRLAMTAGEFYLMRVYGDSESLFDVFTERRDLFAAEFSNSLDYIGWPAGIKVTVTAKWGWLATPEDVREAVLETAIAIWRGRDQAFARVVNLETNVVYNDALTPRAKLIADRYRQGKAIFA